MKYSRWISALLGAPLVILILVFGNVYVIDIAFAIIAAISLHEYFSSFKEKANPIIWIGYLVSAIIAFIHIIPIEKTMSFLGIIVPFSILIMFVQVILTNNKTTIKDISITFFGIFYIAVFLMFIPLIRGSENGKLLIWYVFFAAWMTDTFAYLIGMKFGKHKFSQISPKKSIEGSIAGTCRSNYSNTYIYICM
ncbi:MAG: phosphatidate cytidylyltransferase [Clostridia bacterium]|nr:phosphatidate cytidylyltransferase [Clostridia bacterium]